MPGNLAHRRCIDQWADGGICVQAIADLEFAHLLHQALGEALVNPILHQDPVGANAGLASVAELAEHDAGHCLFQISVVEHNEWRVTAQFQAQALDVFGALTHQQPTDSGGTGKGDLAHRRVAGQFFADADGHTGHYVEHPGRNADALGEHRQSQGGQWSQIRGFDDDRAAGRQSGCAFAGDHRVGEVPRGDRGADANRLLKREQAAVAAGCRDGFAVNPTGFFGEPFDETGAIADLALGFIQRLALFAGHDQRQVVEVVDHRLIPALQQRCPFCRRACAPSRPGAFGSFDGASGFAALHRGYAGEQLAAGRVDNVKGRGVVGADPLTVDVSEFYQQAGVFQAIVEHGRILFRDSLQSIVSPQTRMLKAPPRQP
ncbi:hypothetical protein D3C72_1025370 [compost metagenome]